jgi:ribosomal protein L7/L12
MKLNIIIIIIILLTGSLFLFKMDTFEIIQPDIVYSLDDAELMKSIYGPGSKGNKGEVGNPGNNRTETINSESVIQKTLDAHFQYGLASAAAPVAAAAAPVAAAPIIDTTNKPQISYTKIADKGDKKVQDCPVSSPWTGGKTLEECKQLCTEDENCTTFNMVGGHCNRKACVSCNSATDPNCNLKHYDTNPIEIWGNNRKKISYTKIADKGDQEVQGCPHLRNITGQTLEECKKLCNEDENCTTFNMIGGDCNLKSCVSCNSPNDPRCKLKEYISNDIEIWGNNRTKIHYTKLKQKRDKEVQGCPHLRNITGQTLETCKKLCNEDENCTTFNMIGGDCNLKSCVSCNSANDPNCNFKTYWDNNIEIWGNNR